MSHALNIDMDASTMYHAAQGYDRVADEGLLGRSCSLILFVVSPLFKIRLLQLHVATDSRVVSLKLSCLCSESLR